MKISTNYQRRDWIKLIGSISVLYMLMFVFVTVYVEFFLGPGLDALTMYSKYFQKQDNAREFLLFWLQTKHLAPTTENILGILSKMITMVAFLGIGLIVPIIWIWRYTMKIGYWICNKTRISPVMTLVFFKNDRYWTKFNWEKLKGLK